MFAPTSHLLFRPLGSFTSKLHQQIPLTPRESQQLLNLLTKSFRDHLNREHQLQFRDPAGAQPGLARPRQRRNSDSEYVRPTDRHLHSVLTNPLFAHQPRAPGSKNVKDPAEVFKEAVARGLMTEPYAKAALKEKKRCIVKSAALSVPEAMKESGFGREVLAWLISSGAAKDYAFLKDAELVNILTEFLVAEGHESYVWRWIEWSLKTALTDTLSGHPYKLESCQRAELVLFSLIKSECSSFPTLDRALTSLDKALSTCRTVWEITQHDRQISGTQFSALSRILKLSSNHIIKHITTAPPIHEKSASELFDSFIGSLCSYNARYRVQVPRLLLFHPSKPCAGPALDLLRKCKSSGHVTAPKKGSRHEAVYFDIQKYGKIREIAVFEIGLETARFLLEEDRSNDARWILDFLQSYFPNQLNLEGQEKHLEQAKSEAASLEFLEELNQGLGNKEPESSSFAFSLGRH